MKFNSLFKRFWKDGGSVRALYLRFKGQKTIEVGKKQIVLIHLRAAFQKAFQVSQPLLECLEIHDHVTQSNLSPHGLQRNKSKGYKDGNGGTGLGNKVTGQPFFFKAQGLFFQGFPDLFEVFDKMAAKVKQPDFFGMIPGGEHGMKIKGPAFIFRSFVLPVIDLF